MYYFSLKTYSLQYLLSLVVLLSLLVNCQPDETSDIDNTVIAARDTILFIGSDLTVADGLSPNLGFVQLFADRCTKQQLPVKVINAGVRDESVTGMAERLPLILESRLSWMIFEAASLPPPDVIRQVTETQPEVRVLFLHGKLPADKLQGFKKDLADIQGQLYFREIKAMRKPEQGHLRLSKAVFKVIGRAY